MNTLLDAAKRVIEAHKDGVGLQYEINMLERAVAESEGMVLVPSEPTAEMLQAMHWKNVREGYKDMLAAAEVKP